MLKPIFLAAILFVMGLGVAMWGATFSASYQHCKTYGAEDGSSTDKSGAQKLTPKAPIIDNTFFDCEGAFANASGNAITAVATVFIGVVTALLVLLAWIQLGTTRTQLRAQVYPINFGQLWTPDVPAAGQYSWRFRPNWQNSGETAAEDVAIRVECEVRNSILPGGYDFDSVLDRQPEWPGLLPPKMTLFGGLAPPIQLPAVSPQDIADAIAGRKFIYLYGRVDYADIFPGTEDHTTRFCWRVVPNGDPFTFVPGDAKHALNFDYVLHNEFNYTGEP